MYIKTILRESLPIQWNQNILLVQSSEDLQQKTLMLFNTKNTAFFTLRNRIKWIVLST